MDLDYQRFNELGKRTAHASGVETPESKPVLGQNQFGIEAGIIAASWNRLRESHEPLSMYPYHWEMVGQEEPKITIGKMSGLATIVYWCERLGLELPSEEEQEEILATIKDVSISEKRALDIPEFVDIYREVV